MTDGSSFYIDGKEVSMQEAAKMFYEYYDVAKERDTALENFKKTGGLKEPSFEELKKAPKKSTGDERVVRDDQIEYT